MASKPDLSPPLIAVATAWMVAGYAGLLSQQSAALLSAGALSAAGAIATSQAISKPTTRRRRA